MVNNKPLGIVLIAAYHAVWGTAMLPIGCVFSMASGLPGVSVIRGITVGHEPPEQHIS